MTSLEIHRYRDRFRSSIPRCSKAGGRPYEPVAVNDHQQQHPERFPWGRLLACWHQGCARADAQMHKGKEYCWQHTILERRRNPKPQILFPGTGSIKPNLPAPVPFKTSCGNVTNHYTTGEIQTLWEFQHYWMLFCQPLRENILWQKHTRSITNIDC